MKHIHMHIPFNAKLFGQRRLHRAIHRAESDHALGFLRGLLPLGGKRLAVTAPENPYARVRLGGRVLHAYYINTEQDLNLECGVQTIPGCEEFDHPHGIRFEDQLVEVLGCELDNSSLDTGIT